MSMVKKFWMVGALAVVMAGCNYGNGVRGSVERTVGAFNAVKMETGLEATVVIGPQQPLLLEGDENLLSMIEMKVQGDTLVASVVEGKTVRPSMPFTLRITTPNLVAITANSGSKVTANTLQPVRMDIVADSGSEVTLTGLVTDDVVVQASSAGLVKLEGQGERLTATLSAGTPLTASGFTVETATVNASGGATAEVLATSSITGTISGGSSLTVFGSPTNRDVTVDVGASVTYR